MAEERKGLRELFEVIAKMECGNAITRAYVICPECIENRKWIFAEAGEQAAPGLRQIVIDLLNSADCTWYERNAGHDWRLAVDAARAALTALPSPPRDGNLEATAQKLFTWANSLEHLGRTEDAEFVRKSASSIKETASLAAPAPVKEAPPPEDSREGRLTQFFTEDGVNLPPRKLDLVNRPHDEGLTFDVDDAPSADGQETPE